MIRTDITKLARKNGQVTYEWGQIRGLIWGDDIVQGIEKWARDNMLHAIISFKEESDSEILEVTFVSAR